jgi:hypothetical protein
MPRWASMIPAVTPVGPAPTMTTGAYDVLVMTFT